jgi:putative flavoprotein involved in K+ transport
MSGGLGYRAGVIIVGAGPAGLAAAAMLRKDGHRPALLEQSGHLGDSWRSRWDGLRLHTMRAFSGLPGAAIPRRYGQWVARDDFVTYLREYADRFELEPEFNVTATRVNRDPLGWRVETVNSATGEIGLRQSPIVVIATGYSRVPYIPDWPGRAAFARPIVHSDDYRTPNPYAGQRVLVVGAGNSASEIAVELVEAGAEVTLSVRTPPNIVRRSTFGIPSQLIGLSMKRAPERILNPMSRTLRRLSVPDLSSHGLPAPAEGITQFRRTRTIPVLDHGFVDHVRAGRIRVVAAVDHLSGEVVRCVDGTELTPDVVMCGTGFRPGLESLVGHLGVLDNRGLPLTRGGQSPSNAPGLHFVGITVELSGLLHEINVEVRDLARALRAAA